MNVEFEDKGAEDHTCDSIKREVVMALDWIEMIWFIVSWVENIPYYEYSGDKDTRK